MDVGICRINDELMKINTDRRIFHGKVWTYHSVLNSVGGGGYNIGLSGVFGVCLHGRVKRQGLHTSY